MTTMFDLMELPNHLWAEVFAWLVTDLSEEGRAEVMDLYVSFVGKSELVTTARRMEGQPALLADAYLAALRALHPATVQMHAELIEMTKGRTA